MPSYNIVTVRPAGQPFLALGFQDIARLLSLTLRSLGHACTEQTNVFAADATNIVLGYHLLADRALIEQHRCILFQLEQLPGQRQAWLQVDAHKLSLLRDSRVWDFSVENIALLERHGISSVAHVGFGAHPAMETVEAIAPEGHDIDVLFFGSIGPRRKAILDALAKRCRVKSVYGVFGARRDQFVARAKIVLNLRASETSIMEQPRVSYLLNNRRFVVSEEAADNPYGAALVAVKYDELVERCLAYVDDHAERRRLATVGYEFLAARPMTEIVRRALG